MYCPLYSGIVPVTVTLSELLRTGFIYSHTRSSHLFTNFGVGDNSQTLPVPVRDVTRNHVMHHSSVRIFHTPGKFTRSSQSLPSSFQAFAMSLHLEVLHFMRHFTFIS